MTEKKLDKPHVMHTAPSAEKAYTGLNREIQVKIGQQLRAMYDGIVQEGVPDRFADLLSKLDKPSEDEPSEDESSEDEGKAE